MAKYPTKRGMTMVEIVIVVAIIGIIMSLGLVISMDSFRGYYFRSERSTIVSVLERARSQSIANYQQLPHGACYDTVNKNYVIFEGTYASDPTKEVVGGNKGTSIGTTSTFFLCPTGIIFSQLSGTTTADKIGISDGAKYGEVEVNYEGTINW